MSNNNNTSRKRRYYSDKITNIYHEVHGFPETNSSQFIPTTRIGFYQDFLDALDNFDNYSIGGISFVSGSGFWSTSGFFISNYNSFTETFDDYISTVII